MFHLKWCTMEAYHVQTSVHIVHATNEMPHLAHPTSNRLSPVHKLWCALTASFSFYKSTTRAQVDCMQLAIFCSYKGRA